MNSSRRGAVYGFKLESLSKVRVLCFLNSDDVILTGYVTVYS